MGAAGNMQRNSIERRAYPRAFEGLNITVTVVTQSLKERPAESGWAKSSDRNKTHEVAEIKDISAGGMYFQIPFFLTLKSLISLNVVFAAEGKSFNCEARVLRVEPVPAFNTYNWAVEYTEIEPKDREWLLSFTVKHNRLPQGILSRIFRRR